MRFSIASGKTSERTAKRKTESKSKIESDIPTVKVCKIRAMTHSLCIIEYGGINNFNSLTNSNQNANHLPSLESF